MISSEETPRMEDLYDPKKVDLDYAILIIKPELMLSPEKVEKVKETLSQAGFEIKFSKEKELTQAEIHNVYYKHLEQPYFKKILAYAQSGVSLVALLINPDANPISKLKEVLGGMDPVIEKTKNPSALRAVYGTDIIRNEFYSSDNGSEANREREIFFFPKPQVVPEFKFEVQKITLEQILKFIMPPNLEHPNINSRLDLFGAFGPVKNHHSIDVCLCKNCRKFGIEYLEGFLARKLDEKKQKLGISTKSFAGLSGKTMRGGVTTKTSTSKQKEDPKLKFAPMRLLDEEGILNIWDDMCKKCQEHCGAYVHLVGGRHGQHILTDSEIDTMAAEINRKDILEVLMADKGDGAKVMIQDLKLDLPKEIEYNREMVEILFKDVETDYFHRFEFKCIQKYWAFLLSN